MLYRICSLYIDIIMQRFREELFYNILFTDCIFKYIVFDQYFMMKIPLWSQKRFSGVEYIGFHQLRHLMVSRSSICAGELRKLKWILWSIYVLYLYQYISYNFVRKHWNVFWWFCLVSLLWPDCTEGKIIKRKHKSI